MMVTTRQPKNRQQTAGNTAVLLYTAEDLAARRTIDPRDNIACEHCHSKDVRLIWKWAYEVVDNRRQPARKWIEGEMKVGCMQCLKSSVITRTKTWSKAAIPTALNPFWFTSYQDGD
jgi:hypothetical protein